MATHSTVLAWGIPWAEKPGGLLSMGVAKESDTTDQLTLPLSYTHTELLFSKFHTYTYMHTQNTIMDPMISLDKLLTTQSFT